MPYALFKGDIQMSKGHTTRYAAIIQAIEVGFAYQTGIPDFIGEKGGFQIGFFEDYEIKEYEERTEDAST